MVSLCIYSGAFNFSIVEKIITHEIHEIQKSALIFQNIKLILHFALTSVQIFTDDNKQSQH